MIFIHLIVDSSANYYNISDGFHDDTRRILVPEAEEDLPAIPAWKQGAAEQHPGGAVSPFRTGLWMLLAVQLTAYFPVDQ